MGELLAMRKKMQKQLFAGSSLSLVTVDNMNEGLTYLDGIIAEREKAQLKAAGIKKAAAQTPEEYIMEVLSVSEETAAKLVKEHGDPRRTFAGSALMSNTTIVPLDELENSTDD